MEQKWLDNERFSVLRRILLSLMIIVFFLCIVFVYYSLLYSQTRENIINTGRVNAIESAHQINKHISSSVDSLIIVGYTVDNMLTANRSSGEILDYLSNETTAIQNSLIADTTGLYGYINGIYMDGSGWDPGEDYDPTDRPWYKEAMEGKGNIIIVDPYVDVYTDTVMISIAKSLIDSESVVGIDISLDKLQNILNEHVTSNRAIEEYIINKDGNIVAHSDKSLIGTSYDGVIGSLGASISQKIRQTGDNYFYLTYNKHEYMVYVMPLDYDWTCITVIDSTKDLSKLKTTFIIILLSALAISGIMVLLLILSDKKSIEAKTLSVKSERAVAASEAKTLFLSNMSHEIRTPINAILGMNEMILRESDDETILNYSENIKSAGSTLMGIINDILDFSKIEAGRIEIIPVDYDISNMINDLSNMIRTRAMDKGLELILDIDKEIPRMLNGDEIRVKQVITNILTNAVKYTDSGSVTLRIWFEKTENENDYINLIVSVTDTGIGIKNEDMQKLFVEFERIDEERNRNVEGTGLGMSITQNLLDMMGSSLQVNSVYGKGSTFGFSLKQRVVKWDALGDYTEDNSSKIEELRKNSDTFTAKTANVLVVDDTPINIVVFKNLVKKTKINVDSAVSGDECIEITTKKKYDIIFLDHLMPGKDGIETLKEIKIQKDNYNHDTPFICLTANAVSGAKEQYLSDGFSDYLTKPIVPEKLDEMLLVYLPKYKIVMGKDNVSYADDNLMQETFKEIKSGAENMDCDVLENIFERMEEYIIPDNDKELFEKLKYLSARYDYEGITELLSDKQI